ncbi:MAG: M20 family metallopeptidase [Magnetococcales bacterium]|nr:M20 family metallopeptidase [Magnetococcales bacterium]
MNNHNILLSDLKQIVTINSHTGNKAGVDQVGNHFEKWLSDLGFRLSRHQRSHIGDHLHFCSPTQSGQTLLLLGHMDTVFSPGHFDTYRLDGDWVYGPGVCDMKGGLIVALEALRHTHAKFGKVCNIDFLLVSDEETGSDDSKFLTAKLAKNYDACFVLEAAGDKGALVTGRKGVGTFTLKVRGKAAHAGNRYTEGINANLVAAGLIEKLTELTDLTEGTTVNVGVIKGGVSANTISPMATLLFEIRYQTISERDRLLSSIKTIANDRINGSVLSLEGGIQRDVMASSFEQAALLESLRLISAQNLPTEQRGGVSDANNTSSCGLTTLDGFGPYGDGDHTIDERASLISLRERIVLLFSIFEYLQINKKLF